MIGRCDHCRQDGLRLAYYRGVLLCDECEAEAEREEADAIEAEYEDARWDLAHDYGYDAP